MNTNSKDKMQLPTLRKLHFSPLSIITTAVVIILAGFFLRVAIWEHNYFDRMEGSERHTTYAYNNSGEEVEETQPTDAEISEYIVAADKPRYFSIPSLGITNARIKEVGTSSGGEIATPKNIHDIGWYTGSALPGTNSVSLMDAHGGNMGNGIFRNLPSIQIGAIITIEMGDGRLYTYKVADMTTKNLGEEANDYMKTAFTSPERGKGAITLITCTGDWWLSSQTYSQRLFVRAILQN